MNARRFAQICSAPGVVALTGCVAPTQDEGTAEQGSAVSAGPIFPWSVNWVNASGSGLNGKAATGDLLNAQPASIDYALT